MKNFLKTYKSVIILLVAIIIGTIVGLVFKEKAAILSPFGDIFINLMFIIIIPLVFLSITTAIAKMKQPKRLGKIMVITVIMFLLTGLIALLVGVFSTYKVKLIETKDSETIKNSLVSVEEKEQKDKKEDESILQIVANTLTVNDFSKLLSKSNIIALIVASILFGIAMNMAGDSAKPVEEFLDSCYAIILKLNQIVIWYAPIGLGCYFATMVGKFGESIAVGYAKLFVIYTIVALLFYVVFYTICAFIAGGKRGVVAFWKNIIPSTLTAVGTCSSAACIPVNIEASRKMGISDDISGTVVSLGTSFHKDGSMIGSVFKIMFLVCLFGINPGIGQIIGVSILANLLITGVPIGGGTISEMLILTMMGFPLQALPILTVIATLIDAPATLLNAAGDPNVSMLVARAVDGKNWMDKNKENNKEIKE